MMVGFNLGKLSRKTNRLKYAVKKKFNVPLTDKSILKCKTKTHTHTQPLKINDDRKYAL